MSLTIKQSLSQTQPSCVSHTAICLKGTPLHNHCHQHSHLMSLTHHHFLHNQCHRHNHLHISHEHLCTVTNTTTSCHSHHHLPQTGQSNATRTFTSISHTLTSLPSSYDTSPVTPITNHDDISRHNNYVHHPFIHLEYTVKRS